MKRLLVGIAVVALPMVAQAYILSANAVLRRMAAQRSELQLSSLIVRGQFTFHGEEARQVAAALGRPAADTMTIPAVATYKMPGRCRIELAPPGVPDAPAASNVNGALSTAGTKLPSLVAFSTLACPLLDQRGGADGPATFARQSGVDLSKISLGRLNGTIAYVIGGRSRDANVPTLWIEKERFAPLRLVLRDGAGGMRELRLLDYSSPAAGEWHPRVIELRRGEDVQAVFKVDSVEPNARVPDAIF